MIAISRRLALFAGAAAVLSACNRGDEPGALKDMTLGDPKAPVKVIEYASLSCSHCMRFNNEVFPAFRAKYIDTGKVHYTFRDLAPDPVATAGALIARCAGEEKYFQVVDEWFHTLERMLRSGDQDYRAGLLQVARGAGLTEERFNSCVSDADAIKALSGRAEKFADEDKVTGTPTFIIGDKRLVGEQTLETLSAVIDPMLT